MKHGSVFRFTDFETYGDYPEGVDVEWPNLSILTEEAVALVGASPARIEKGIQEDETLAAVTHELTNSELLPKLKEMTGYEYHIFEGFPGFWRFCAEAGLHLSEHEKEVGGFGDNWVETIDQFCAAIITQTLENGSLPDTLIIAKEFDKSDDARCVVVKWREIFGDAGYRDYMTDSDIILVIGKNLQGPAIKTCQELSDDFAMGKEELYKARTIIVSYGGRGGDFLLMMDAVKIYHECEDEQSCVAGLKERLGNSGEVPLYPRHDWSSEAKGGDTQLGYWEWAFHKLDEAACE